MDALIKKFDFVENGDLCLCEQNGVAYQRDFSVSRVSYDANYLAKVDAYEDTDIAREVNAGRCALLSRHITKGATVLDIGAGSGAFVRAAEAAGFVAKGYEVIPQAVTRLREMGIYANPAPRFDATTMWDVIEHLERPEDYLRLIAPGACLFVSVPLFADLQRIRESKHYRPGEHYFYFTVYGFINWMGDHGFRFLEFSGHEMDAGRENIGAFAFRRNVQLGTRWTASI